MHGFLCSGTVGETEGRGGGGEEEEEEEDEDRAVHVLWLGCLGFPLKLTADSKLAFCKRSRIFWASSSDISPF